MLSLVVMTVSNSVQWADSAILPFPALTEIAMYVRQRHLPWHAYGMAKSVLCHRVQVLLSFPCMSLPPSGSRVPNSARVPADVSPPILLTDRVTASVCCRAGTAQTAWWPWPLLPLFLALRWISHVPHPLWPCCTTCHYTIRNVVDIAMVNVSFALRG